METITTLLAALIIGVFVITPAVVVANLVTKRIEENRSRK